MYIIIDVRKLTFFKSQVLFLLLFWTVHVMSWRSTILTKPFTTRLFLKPKLQQQRHHENYNYPFSFSWIHSSSSAAAATVAVAVTGGSFHRMSRWSRYDQMSMSLSRNKYHQLYSTSLSSEAAATEAAATEAAAATTTKTTTSLSSTTSCFPTVVVKRNHQSMEFRRGNPMIYANSIAYTFGGPSSSSSSSSSSLDMGTLVQIHVEQKSESKPNKKSNRKQSTEQSSSYPHYHHSPTKTELGTFLGWGIYNPHSLYRVRILCHVTLHPLLAKSLSKILSSSLTKLDEISTKSLSSQMVSKIVHHHVLSAWNLRQTILLNTNITNDETSFPIDNTTAYRWINGEGDGLSGLAVDVLDSWTVVMSSASWCEIFRTEIETALQEIRPPSMPLDQEGKDDEHHHRIIWKRTLRRLHQDGWNSTTLTTDISDDTTRMDQSVIIRENGILFRTYPFQDGQKTGFYCDQRDNRLYLAQHFCRNKRVLDLCCFQGGFSLAAKILGGAAHCTGVDSSQAAIDACWENAKLNHLLQLDKDTDMTKQDIIFVRDDVAHFLTKAHEDPSLPKSWDIIILDPPKLAPTQSGLDRASRKYHSLNRDAIRLMDPQNGGLLLTCTCSAAMTQKDGGTFFVQTVQQAAMAAGRHVTLLRMTGAAVCHTQSPASHPAGSYLTAAWFYVSPQQQQQQQEEEEEEEEK
jgi:23S rRNA G2069 N7-methylase RlmK/C1962 C5-methylase RlmI